MVGDGLTPEEMTLFLEEARDQLRIMEEAFLVLEQDPGRADVVQDAFRAAHTLKGGAATVGLADVAELTHVMESALEPIRRGQGAMSGGLVDRLLRGVDLIESYLEAVAAGETPDGSGLAACADDLRAFARAQEAPAGGLVASAGAPTPAAVQPAEVDTSDATAEPAIRWWVEVGPDEPMPSIRLYQAVLFLEGQGRILRCAPPLEQIEEETSEHRAIVVDVADCEDPDAVVSSLQQITGVRSVRWQALKPRGQRVHRDQPAKDEGRPPLGPSVRVEVGVLDRLMNLVGELVIDRTRLSQLSASSLSDQELRDELGRLAGRLSRISSELQDTILRTRMMPVATLFKQFPRMIRDLSRQLGKPVHFEMSGEETELDRSVIEHVRDPLIHLLRNAVDHGIESEAERRRAGKPVPGTVRLAAYHQGNSIFITVEDDGRGLDPDRLLAAALSKGLLSEEKAAHLSREDLLDLIFLPGFSTAQQVSAVSGRGVGMDVVKRNIEKVNGSITVESEPGQGTTFTIKLPLTLAILQALLVDIAGTTFALPLANVVETNRVRLGDLDRAHGWRMLRVRGQTIPLVDPGELWGDEAAVSWSDRRPNPVVVVQAGAAPLALMVDRLLGEEEIVIKSLGPIIGSVSGIAGASILGDGRVALIVDVGSLTREVRHQHQDLARYRRVGGHGARFGRR